MIKFKKHLRIMIFIFFYFLILQLIQVVKSDLPVHCRKEQIVGTYIFRIEQEVFQADLKNSKTSCGHGFPDKIEKTEDDINFSFKKYRDIEISLAYDYNVIENNEVVGNWTAVYDEGFIAYYKDSVFTAFMKYYMKKGNYLSNCDKTMIGWYVPDTKHNDKNWSCFFGFKTILKDQFESNNNNNNNNVNKVQATNMLQLKFPNIIAHTPNQIASVNLFSTKHLKKMDALEKRLLNGKMHYDAQEEFVGEINSLNKIHWHAEIIDEFKGLSFDQLKYKLGLKKRENKSTKRSNNFLQLKSSMNIKKNKGNFHAHKANFSKKKAKSVKKAKNGEETYDYNEIIKYIDTEIKDINSDELPKSWDWRNIGGQSYVPNPQRQGSCGSCYVFSIVTSLEARLRILSNNKDKTEFSKQFPLACSFYTEGCEGGYPIFIAKFLNEFELIPESCFPYNPDSVQCSNYCDYTKLPNKYKVTRYEYLGGSYGATSEESIMKEIRARGPVPGNMSIPWTFMYYKSGIYNQTGLKQNAGKLSKTTLLDQKLSWVNVEHSILLVGWGEEDGIKFWIGMNTWGNNWGENGYFRILRGENECNIETMGDAARISVSPRSL